MTASRAASPARPALDAIAGAGASVDCRPVSVVRPAFGPTLPQLLGPRRWRVVRAISIAVAIAVAAIVVAGRASSSERAVIGHGTPSFNYTYAAPLRRVGATDVEDVRSGVFVQSMTVRTLRLPAYRGDASGTLAILADALSSRLAAEHPGFTSVSEGRARINDNPGYYIAWEAMLGKRRLFGRDYMLVPGETTAPRSGVRLELLSTYAGGVSGADDVGRAGKLKQTLRSFRFGTERP